MSYRCTSTQAVRYEALCSYIRVRCRRCDKCLEARRHIWMLRAAREQVKAKRTWFVTLTFGPKGRAAIMSSASARDNGISQPVRLQRASGWFVQTLVKRLRKQGFGLRYLFIAEPHLDGFPHWHGLVHDLTGWSSLEQVFRKQKDGSFRLMTICPEIENEYLTGRCAAELVRDAGALRYVTKYLAKGRFGKIRASRAYGEEECVPEPSDSALHPSSLLERKEREEEGSLPLRRGERKDSPTPHSQ